MGYLIENLKLVTSPLRTPMIGIIPHVWMINIRGLATPDQVTLILQSCGREAGFQYALDQPYGDDECARLIEASSSVLQLSRQALFESFAQAFMEDAKKRWPVWFEMAPTARDFLERQPRIHDRFGRGLNHHHRGDTTVTSKFDVQETAQGLRVLYRSPNQLCQLYMAMTRALLAHYQETAVLSQTACTHQGDAHCDIHIDWPASPTSLTSAVVPTPPAALA
jgi:hypothetical protein